MKVLLTNDDGIGASGLGALRRALVGISELDVSVVAPDSNRSATARSITTRSPLRVEEITYDDGGSGFAASGTPVDCVRFADLGLVGERPDLIVSGINHGANLGDDITYSGTVAAAFEGIVLGIPAMAVSQQSARGEMGYHSVSSYDFRWSAAFTAQLVRTLIERPIGADTLINVNVPAGRPESVEVTRLGKRIYNDELKLVRTDEQGHRHYEIYGFEPSFEDLPGTDLAAIARGRVSVTPVHFDLTDQPGLEELGEWDLEEALRACEQVADSVEAGDGE